MFRQASADARPGDIVAVYNKDGERFGTAFYNPRSNIALRMIAHDDREIDEEFFREVLTRAVSLRRETLQLDEQTDSYRVFHSEGDGLSGLTVDRYDDALSVQIYSYGAYRQLDSILPILHELCGTTKERIQVDTRVAALEGFQPTVEGTEGLQSVRIRENGVRYAVNFESGHKTGFFCDQRDNRARLATLVRGKSVLDLCCYTGGFSLAARVAGHAESVTGVDLDEKAIDQARHNANLNQTRVNWVHADVFSYARQMAQNDRQWDVVISDPSKLIASRDEEKFEEGRRKYQDLNRLAIGLVAPGGLFLTCSCSGLVSMDDFEQWVIYSAHRQGRRLQIIERTGAGADHPVLSNCLESRYLKAIWARIF
jgi:23S rRNA (cytosine1962-C5)-methyltransferase